MAPTNRLHTSAQHRSTTKHVTVVCNMKHHGIQKCPYILSACIILEQGFLFIYYLTQKSSNSASASTPPSLHRVHYSKDCKDHWGQKKVQFHNPVVSLFHQEQSDASKSLCIKQSKSPLSFLFVSSCTQNWVTVKGNICFFRTVYCILSVLHFLSQGI